MRYCFRDHRSEQDWRRAREYQLFEIERVLALPPPSHELVADQDSDERRKLDRYRASEKDEGGDTGSGEKEMADLPFLKEVITAEEERQVAEQEYDDARLTNKP